MTQELLIFTSPTCAPCRTLKESIAGVDMGVPVRYVDVTEDVDTAFRYRVRQVPTLVVTEADGAPIDIRTGMVGKFEVLRFVDRALRREVV